MNSTNRAANRLLLLIVSIVLLALAAVALALASVPTILTAWGTQSRTVMSSVPTSATRPVIGTVGWPAIAIGVVAVVVAILLVAFVVRQGRGHVSRVVEQRTGTNGATLVDLGVPRALLLEDLDDRPEFVAARISAYRVGRTPTLKVSVQCRRGVSPIDAARIVTRSLEGLDQVLGIRLPALVQISGGFRSRTSSRVRLG